MSQYTISMPHRYLVRYADERSILDYEVEALADGGIAFYCNGPMSASGLPADEGRVVAAIESWLRESFPTVEMDHTPPAPKGGLV